VFGPPAEYSCFAFALFWEASAISRGTKLPLPHFLREAVARRSIRRLSRIAKGLRPAVQNARARIAKGGGLIGSQSRFEGKPS
jgi:hypothetical protein